MKRNKLKILATAALIGVAGLGLASCGDDTKPSVSSSIVEPTEVTVSSISVTGGKTEFTVGDSWSSGSLVVTATYSDGTSGNVTANATVNHSSVDLTKAGTYTVTVTFESVTTTYSVTVKAAAVTNVSLIIIDEAAKKDYLVGETFSADGLVVKILKSDDSEEDTTAFTTAVFTDEACTQAATGLTEAGTYYVKVTAGTLSDKYSITVDTAKYTVKAATTFETLNANIAENTNIYTEAGVGSIDILANASSYVSVDGNNQTFDGVSYTHRLKLNGTALASGETSLKVDESGNVTNGRTIKVVLERDASLELLARSGTAGEERELVITNMSDVAESFAVDAMAKKSFDLKAGTYYVYSKSKGINLYSIGINYDVEASSLTYESITANTSGLPETFDRESAIDLSSLKVTGTNNYGTVDTLTNYVVKDSEGAVVDSAYRFATPGVKTLTIEYNGKTTTIEIQVVAQDSATQAITLDTTKAELVFKKGESFSLGSLGVTAKDQYEIETTVSLTDTGLTYKILSGTTDVTDTFTTLSKGTYTVEVAYETKTAQYTITMLEVQGATFTNPALEVEKDSTVINSSEANITITYTDGTEADYSKFNDVIGTSSADFVIKFYSDSAATTETTVAEMSTTVGNKFYGVMTYKEYTSATLEFTVVGELTERNFEASALAATADKTKLTSLGDDFFTVDGNVTARASTSTTVTTANPFAVELEKRAGGAIVFTVTKTSNVTMVINSTGSSNASFFLLIDDKGNEITCDNGAYFVYGQKKDGTGTTITYTGLAAGTYKLVAKAKTGVEISDTNTIAVNGEATQTAKAMDGRAIQVVSIKVENN